jgi:O-antigen ligase/polysaccharide polymerase Wzy-like membrane protein
MDARAPMALAIGHPGSSAALAGRLLNFVLFVTVLLSSIAFVEPSPHDVMMFVLLVACNTARLPFDRRLTPLLALTVVWLVGGAMSLMQVASTEELHPILNQDPIQYFGTSVYLGLAAIMFACLFSNGNLTRLSILRRAYILAALIATVAGFIGFFHLLPGSEIFLDNSRVSATFKDPNVYGPFLVFPILMLMIGFLTQRVTLVGLLISAFLSSGLFLSFSRGAWVHLAVSATVAVTLCYLTAPNTRMRARIVAFGLLTTLAIAIALIALLSISSVHELFVERARVLQPYDIAGSGGRFALQELAIGDILEHPNGMGPYGFSNSTIGGQQHNVYLQAFLVYGWLGGAAYLGIVFFTFLIGLRCLFLRTPWQPYLIAAYAAYIGEIAEGMIIDTDHWRHFFLVLGLVWGLSVANINRQHRQTREVMLA